MNRQMLTDTDKDKYFPEKDLGGNLMQFFYDVRNKYGRWYSEKVYDKALKEQLELKKINFIYQPRIDIYSVDTGKKISTYVPDFLIEDKILVENKVNPYFSQENMDQALQYLKNCRYEIIYLVNFREKDFKPRRFIATNDRKFFLKSV